MHDRAGSQARLALEDLREALGLSWFWLELGWIDILLRYRRSMLGPLWLTLTTAAFIAGLGPLYARLFNLNMTDYLPHLAIGMTTWSFVSGAIIDCGTAFIAARDTMTQIRLPRLALLFQVLWRNLIIFIHSLPIFAVVLAVLGPPPSAVMLLALPGLALVVLNLAWMGLVVAILCVRFRDFGPIVTAIMQIAFFLTPVMWDSRSQRVEGPLVSLNPFGAFIELVRAPLLGHAPSLMEAALALASLALGGLLAALLFIRTRRRLVYWV